MDARQSGGCCCTRNMWNGGIILGRKSFM
ncbi:hypothetical protein GCK32_001554 [Trichostrongylus colubriformis]|uniref:Uncharacterized protein n=1 Tax=Trichostrongylus colubriformis TaxID=6319 RepID=A0AAN8GEU7_TRICO